MLDHVSIGVRDIAATRRFYDAALAPLGYTCLSAGADSLGYGRDGVAFWISKADRPVPADAGSGLHFCFTADDRAAVDAFHDGFLMLTAAFLAGLVTTVLLMRRTARLP